MNAMSGAAVLAGIVSLVAGAGMGRADGAPLDASAARFGTAQVVDTGGQATAYTVNDLRPADTDTLNVPLAGDVRLAGALWQATTTADALRGSAVPAMRAFSARSADGQTYRVLVQTFAPDLEISPLDQGRSSTGRIYFDVTGAAPDEVVFDDGVHRPITWSG